MMTWTSRAKARLRQRTGSTRAAAPSGKTLSCPRRSKTGTRSSSRTRGAGTSFASSDDDDVISTSEETAMENDVNLGRDTISIQVFSGATV
eukprot:6576232-Pyramimonas_sp.AAC.1